MEYFIHDRCAITGWQIDQQAKRNYKLHPASGISRTTEYRSWQEMKRRGYEVCKEWEASFENFLKDMGKKPSKQHMLSRYDDTKMYCKENCFWKPRRP